MKNMHEQYMRSALALNKKSDKIVVVSGLGPILNTEISRSARNIKLQIDTLTRQLEARKKRKKSPAFWLNALHCSCVQVFSRA